MPSFLFVLALIPVIGLILFIYFKDKGEKEPFGFLISLFFLGMATTISAVILEAIGEGILGAAFSYETVGSSLIRAFFVVAPAEELGKYLILRLRTWKSRHFDYSYDAIVYSVFISLGFAALENVLYVISSGIGTALMRMFTAVPGHACFAVMMGFFYSKAKYASVTGNKGKCRLFKALAMLIPILTHGIYDGILFAGEAMGDDAGMAFSVIAWIVFVIALFVVSFILVIKSSRNDFCIVTVTPEGNSAPIQTVYKPSVVGSWTCACGSVNQHNFCGRCGAHRPMVNIWNCPTCGTLCTLNFCGQCGAQKPLVQTASPYAPAGQPVASVPVAANPAVPVAAAPVSPYAPVAQPVQPVQPAPVSPYAPPASGYAQPVQPAPMQQNPNNPNPYMG